MASATRDHFSSRLGDAGLGRRARQYLEVPLTGRPERRGIVPGGLSAGIALHRAAADDIGSQPWPRRTQQRHQHFPETGAACKCTEDVKE